MPNTQGSQEQKISSLVNCREIFLSDLCFKLACSLFQFDLIQVVGPFVHTLSHNKKPKQCAILLSIILK